MARLPSRLRFTFAESFQLAESLIVELEALGLVVEFDAERAISDQTEDFVSLGIVHLVDEEHGLGH